MKHAIDLGGYCRGIRHITKSSARKPMTGIVVIDAVQIIIEHKYVITVGDQRRSNAKANARCTAGNDGNLSLIHI